MGSRKQKKASVLHEKLQLLRSMTHSHALNKTSIIIDASNYIEDLKHKIQRLNQDIASSQTSNNFQNHPFQVAVETLEKGFLINVDLEKSCPGLLVQILQVFEELGLTVVEARVSCTDTFQLQAVAEQNEEQAGEAINVGSLKHAVELATKNWIDISQQG